MNKPDIKRLKELGVEEWRLIDGFDGKYLVSNTGTVRTIAGKLLAQTRSRKGYFTCSIMGKNRLVHRLVASAFIDNPNSFPQVNHIDGNPGNNLADNLEWVTNAQNQIHACHVLMKRVRPVVGVSISDGSVVRFSSLQHAVNAGFKRSNIQKCINGTRSQHHGYRWTAIDAAMRDKP